MFKRVSFLALLGWLLCAGPLQAAQDEQQSLLALQALDGRVATIGHRLAVANAALCPQRQWLAGITIHDLSQYGGAFRDAAIRAFRLDRGPGVLALASAGPAERAGLRRDDTILAADGVSLSQPASRTARTFALAERMLETLEAAFADGHAQLTVLRGDERLTIDIAAEQGCPTRFQLIPSRRLNARADGRYVQVTSAISEYVRDEDELATVIAHEFAHNVLRHRVRLDEAGVARGFLGNFGRNARLIRGTEAEADRLSVHLLDRAGYDPAAAIRFWSRFGPRGLNFLGSPTHPNWRARIASFEAEIEAMRRARAEGREPVPPLAAEVNPTAPPH